MDVSFVVEQKNGSVEIGRCIQGVDGVDHAARSHASERARRSGAGTRRVETIRTHGLLMSVTGAPSEGADSSASMLGLRYGMRLL